jgi:hypothetical protein
MPLGALDRAGVDISEHGCLTDSTCFDDGGCGAAKCVGPSLYGPCGISWSDTRSVEEATDHALVDHQGNSAISASSELVGDALAYGDVQDDSCAWTLGKDLVEKTLDLSMISTELDAVCGDQGVKMFLDLDLFAHRLSW